MWIYMTHVFESKKKYDENKTRSNVMKKKTEKTKS